MRQRYPGIVCLMLFLNACISQQSFLPTGAFYAILPCADCSGIHYELILGEDNTYTENLFYEGKSTEAINHSGRYEILQNKVVTLADKPVNGGFRQFVIEGNTLRMLNMSSGPVEGKLADRYVLSKDKPAGFVMQIPENLKRYDGDLRLHDIWAVTALNGISTGRQKAPDMEFNLKEKRVSGFAGCNRFAGSFVIEKGKLSFGEMASTRMACPDMKQEEAMLKLISSQKMTYRFVDNGLFLESESGTILLKKVD